MWPLNAVNEAALPKDEKQYLTSVTLVPEWMT